MIHISSTCKFNLFSVSTDALNEMRRKINTNKINTSQKKLPVATKRKQKEISPIEPPRKSLKEKEVFNEMDNNEYFERLAEEAEQQERQVGIF